MKPVKFGNERALQITNTLLINEIINKVETTYNIDIDYKRYHFFDKNNAHELRKKRYSFVLNTYGAKYIVFLTHINFKKYVLYISRKNKEIYFVKTRFDEKLYTDTIFEGEIIKINERWYFYIGDMLVYQGNYVVNEPYHYRRNLIDELIYEKYVSDTNLEAFTLLKKDYFSYRDIDNVIQKYIPSLPFQVNGFLFKCEENSSYDILYIFPHCVNSKNKKQENTSIQKMKNHKIEKNDATFLMRKMELPDVYELCMFNKETKKKAKVAYAGVPSIQHSKQFREWFKDIEEKDEEGYLYLYAKCHKDEVNEKWIPISKINL